MKKIYLYGVVMIVLLSLVSGLILAQDASATEEPVSDFAPPTSALMPCPVQVTAETVCDVIATQPEDIVGHFIEARPGHHPADLSLFAESQQIGQHAEMFTAPGATGDPQPALHFVEDQQDLVLITDAA